MGFRKCPVCDRYLTTAEYTVSEGGETICPVHLVSLHGFKDDTAPEMRQVAGANREPYRRAYEALKEEFGTVTPSLEAVEEYDGDHEALDPTPVSEI